MKKRIAIVIGIIILVLALIMLGVKFLSGYEITISVSEKGNEIEESVETENLEEVEEELEAEETESEEIEQEEKDDTNNTTIVYKQDELDFGVGNGIEWKDGIFASFADMGAWVTDPGLSNDGAINLGQVLRETGAKWYNLGFINAVDATVNDGVLNWGFGGYEILSESKGANDAQYQGIKDSMREVRAQGGDVTISIGGLNERNFFQYTDDIDVLVNTYVEIIDGYNLTRIDLDIEGSAQGYEQNLTNAKAMKIVQEKTGVEVVLTLPVLPTGLTENLGLPTLRAYLESGVDVQAVNIMAMCYGSYFGAYGPASLEAIDATMRQIISEYEKVGITLTEEEAYGKVAVTTSIGFEGEAHPIFTTQDSKLVVDYAKEKGIQFVSFWSINRDTLTVPNKGIGSKYEHTPIYLSFETGEQLDFIQQEDEANYYLEEEQ